MEEKIPQEKCTHMMITKVRVTEPEIPVGDSKKILKPTSCHSVLYVLIPTSKIAVRTGSHEKIPGAAPVLDRMLQ